MRNLHCGGRFLRFLRSICSKTACARRAIVALFVAVATILATFMIMPSASMGASQQGEPKQAQTQTEKPENKTAETAGAPAKNGSAAQGDAAAKGDAEESKTEESKTVDPNNSQTPSKQGGSNADHAQNVDSTKKQQNSDVEGVNKSLNKDTAAAKDAEKSAKKDEAANKLRLQKRELGNTRAAADSTPLPKECSDAGITELAKCYVAEYFYTIRKKKRVVIKKSITINNIGESHTITPVFRRVKKINDKGIPTIDEETDASSSVKGLIESFSLERLSTESTALESNVENNDFVKVDPTSGEIKIHANKWLNNGSYYVFVKVKYKDNSTLTRSQWCTNSCSPSYNKYSRFSIQIRYKNPTNDVLSLKVYNHQDSKDRAEVKDNGIAATVESDDKGNFSPITPIFIDTTSSKRPNLIYHRMVCHKDGDETKDSDYYLNSINGLTLSDSATPAGGSTSHNPPPTQKQWDHALGKRPDDNKLSESSGNLYESDDIIERSQSWITGTPKEAGTFICKVLALKGVSVSSSSVKTYHYTFDQVFDSKISDSSTHLKQNLFDTNVKVEDIFSAYVPEKQSPEDPTPNPYGIFESGAYDRKKVWDVKTIKIVFESKKKQKLEVKDGDLKLNVYPFKNNDSGSGGASSALADGDIVSVMKGIELKPFIEATSKADSTKQITLKMLCSKGEKPQKTNAGAAGGASNASKTGAADLEYTKWVDPSSLGFSFPDDKAQKPCTSNEGEQDCKPDGSDTKFAARTNASATFMSTEAVDYQCVVYALKKPDALAKFNDEAAKPDVTPDNISAAFTSANLTANKDYAKLAINIHVTEKFTLPKTGGQNWNLQLGAVAAVMVSVLAAGFVISQSEACRKLLYERRRC
ncbi:hypothetical protein HXT36_04225 [Gardnerella sp. DNF01144]|uniref:hypothetical protein n=1 Tax=Gardnerella sp. DNF01144 TaxID=2749058 RepID=UPI003BAB4822